jgi:hypothetical protein
MHQDAKGPLAEIYPVQVGPMGGRTYGPMVCTCRRIERNLVRHLHDQQDRPPTSVIN